MTPHYEDEFDPFDYYDFDPYDDWDEFEEEEECDLCAGEGVILDYRYGIGRVVVTCPVCDGDGFYY